MSRALWAYSLVRFSFLPSNFARFRLQFASSRSLPESSPATQLSVSRSRAVLSSSTLSGRVPAPISRIYTLSLSKTRSRIYSARLTYPAL